MRKQIFESIQQNKKPAMKQYQLPSIPFSQTKQNFYPQFMIQASKIQSKNRSSQAPLRLHSEDKSIKNMTNNHFFQTIHNRQFLQTKTSFKLPNKLLQSWNNQGQLTEIKKVIQIQDSIENQEKYEKYEKFEDSRTNDGQTCSSMNSISSKPTAIKQISADIFDEASIIDSVNQNLQTENYRFNRNFQLLNPQVLTKQLIPQIKISQDNKINKYKIQRRKVRASTLENNTNQQSFNQSKIFQKNFNLINKEENNLFKQLYQLMEEKFQ